MSISFHGGMRTGGANGFISWTKEHKYDLEDLRSMKAELAAVRNQISAKKAINSDISDLQKRESELSERISGKENELEVDAYEIALESGNIANARILFQKFTPAQKAMATPLPTSGSLVNNYQNN
jgi:hypothetical protein